MKIRGVEINDGDVVEIEYPNFFKGTHKNIGVFYALERREYFLGCDFLLSSYKKAEKEAISSIVPICDYDSRKVLNIRKIGR